jgi:outer membrane lipase/esterase
MSGAIVVATASAGAAQNFAVTNFFDRVITFGDSYSDTGNRLALEPTGTQPFFLPGRFSNGPVFTELLSGGFVTPLVDPAFQTQAGIFDGTATTASIAAIFGPTDPRLIGFVNDLNAARGTSFTPQDIIDGAINDDTVTAALNDLLEPSDIFGLGLNQDLGSGVLATSNLNFAFGGAESLRSRDFVPSTRQQVEFYFANGGTFNDGDLITFLSGANDNSQLGLTNSVSLGTAVGLENAAVIERIAQSGTGTIAVVGLADLSLIPGGRNSGPLVQQIARDFSFSAINTQFAELQRIAAANPQVNIIYVDLLALQGAVEADPAGFGFANITNTCITEPTPGTPVLCSDPDSFFFIDFIHPTAAGHRLLANLVIAHVLAGQSALNTFVMDEMALSSRRFATDANFDRLNRLAKAEGNFGLFIEGFGGSMESDFDPDRPAYTGALSGVRVGAERRFGENVIAGVALGFADGDVNQQIVDFNFSSVQFDLYGRYAMGRAFLDLTFGYEAIDYDNITRFLNVGPLVNTGATSGHTYSVAGRVGQSFDFQAATITPALKIAYYNTHVDGYQEAGTLARINFADRSGEYLIGGLEILADFQVTQSVHMFTSASYDVLITGSQPDIIGQLVNNTAQPFVVQPGNPDVSGLNLSLGLTANLGAGFIGDARVQLVPQFNGDLASRFTFGINKPL